MAARFQTTIKKARFVHTPFTGQQMAAFGNGLLEHIWGRIDQGLNVYEAPARPLAAGYARYKRRRTGSDLRNLQNSGRLRRSTKVLEANENKAVLGATPGIHSIGKRGRSSITFNGVLAVNTRRERLWVITNSDRVHVVGLVMGRRPVQAKAVA